jgi:hypothetical protein
MECTFCEENDGQAVMIVVPAGGQIVCPACLRRAVDLLAVEKGAVRRAVKDITRDRDVD